MSVLCMMDNCLVDEFYNIELSNWKEEDIVIRGEARGSILEECSLTF